MNQNQNDSKKIIEEIKNQKSEPTPQQAWHEAHEALGLEDF